MRRSALRAAFGVVLATVVVLSGAIAVAGNAGSTGPHASGPSIAGSVGATAVALARAAVALSPTYTGPAVWTGSMRASEPPPRVDESMAYDAKDGYVVMFGGDYNGALGDTWIFERGTWVQLHPAVHPIARYGAAMVYDAKDGYVLLFGGVSSAKNRALDSTWEFSGGSWTELHPSVHPNERYDVGIAYDARDGYVVLYGGQGTFYHSAFYDTWTFAGGTWTKLPHAGNPPVYSEETMVFDAKVGYVLLFGGFYAPGRAGDETWSFSAGVWSRVTTAMGPASRAFAAMVYDAHDGYVLLFGGYANGFDRHDTWEYAAGVWTRIHPGAGPGRLTSESQMVYDPRAGEVLLLGYSSAHTAMRTWSYAGGVWARR